MDIMLTEHPGLDKLSILPVEIVKAIFQNVLEKKDLSALCSVSKLFHTIATPLLYNLLEILCPDGFNPRFSLLKRFSASWPQVEFSPSLKYVRHLALIAKFKKYMYAGTRCWHHRYRYKEDRDECIFVRHSRNCIGNVGGDASSTEIDEKGNADEYDDDDEEEEENEEEAEEAEDEDDFELPPCPFCSFDQDKPEFYEDHFRVFCLGLSENSLLSFRWELGSCVPENLLGQDGYLTKHQFNVEKLSLHTDGACNMAIKGRNVYHLYRFRNIREFSWIRPQSVDDFEAIRDCFDANSSHMEVLKIDTISWSKADDNWHRGRTLYSSSRQSKNFFAEHILNLLTESSGKNRGRHFPVLRDLYLGQLSFNFAISGFIRAFNIFNLKRLAIWNCPGMAELIEHLTTSEQSLQLVSLELVCGFVSDFDDYFKMGYVVPGFLRKFVGLETLHLSLTTDNWGYITESLDPHLETLESVVLNARSVNNVEDSPYFEREEDYTFSFYKSICDLFTNSVTEIISMPFEPDNFEWLQPYAKEVTCKLLHLRATEDVILRVLDEFEVESGWFTLDELIDNFAQWAFGPEGLPQLLVFAYGDFAFPKTCRKYNKLYCRNNSIGKGDDDPAYEVLTPTNIKIWNWVQSNMDTLSACPYRSVHRV